VSMHYKGMLGDSGKKFDASTFPSLTPFPPRFCERSLIVCSQKVTIEANPSSSL
jgi:hypothetical protein